MMAAATADVTPVRAQIANDPAAIERTIPKRLTPQTALPRIELPKSDAGSTQPATPQFILTSVNIDGATVFTGAELSATFEPFLATSVDHAQLQDIASRITQQYRTAGYLLSYAAVPAQKIASGIVRIDVVEGRIDRLTIEGGGAQQGKLEGIAAPLLKRGPLNARILERVIGLIRALPGFEVTDVRIGRSTNDPESNYLTITVSRDRVQALGYFDNRGTERAGRERFYTSASISSLVTAGDELRAELFAIPGHGYHYLYAQLAARVPLGSNGWRLGVAASRGDQYQKFSSGKLDGASTNLSAEISYRLVQSRALSAIARLSVNDWRSLDDFNSVRLQRDHLRVARLGLDIAQGKKNRVEAQLALSHGFAFDGVTRRGDPLASRTDGSGVFTKVNANVQIVRPVSGKFVLRLNVAGQYSSAPLLSAEEFSLGGSAIGRAYDFNTLTGDHGIAGGGELAYRMGDSKRGPQQVEVFTYADGGAVFQSGNQSGQPQSQRLSSVGAGSRFAFAGFAFSVEVGVPLRRVDGEKSVRGFLSIAKSL